MHKLHANLQLRCKRDPGLRHVLQRSTHSLHSKQPQCKSDSVDSERSSGRGSAEERDWTFSSQGLGKALGGSRI